MRIDVMGVGFDSLTMDEAVARARDLMAERRAAYVVTPNPEIVMLCRDDPAAMPFAKSISFTKFFQL